MPLTPKVQSPFLLLNCVNHFLIPLLSNKTRVILVDFDGKLSFPLTRYRLKEEEIQIPLEKHNVYVLDSRRNNLNVTFTYLEKRSFFNPRATFVVVTERVEDSMFAVRIFMVETAIILEYVSLEEIVVYTYQPHKMEKMERSFQMLSRTGSCTNKKIEEISLYDPEHHRKVEREKPKVKIGVAGNIPSVILEEGLPTSGVDIEMLKIIRERLNFETQLIMIDDYAGIKDSKYLTFNGSLGFLQRREVDFVIGGVFPTTDGFKSFDFTRTTSINKFVWIVPAAKVRPLWKRLIFIFKRSVWYLFFTAFIAILAILSLVNKFIIKGKYYWGNELLKLYSMCFTSVHVRSVEKKPKKILYMCWYFFLLIFLDYFTAKLLTNLIVKKYEYQIHDLEGLPADWKICLHSDLPRDIGYFGHEKMYCTNCSSCTNKTAFDGNVVSIRNLDITEYEMDKYYINKDHEPLIFILRQYFLVTHNVMAFRKNHPLFEKFNKVLGYLMESGVYERIRKKYIFSESDHDQRELWAALKMEQVIFIFKFLVYGWLLSFVVFVIELLRRKYLDVFKNNIERL